MLSPAILSQISDYYLLARTAVEGLLAGLHRSRCRGTGSEFLQYRSYVPGDDLKYLDWKLLARQNKACTRVFQEETNFQCAIIIDSSASMEYQGKTATCSKFRYASALAACLAYLAGTQGDQPGIFTYSDKVNVTLPPGSLRNHSPKLYASLESARPEGIANHALPSKIVEEFLPRRSLIVWISDFHDTEKQLGKTLREFRFRGHDTILFQIIDPDERTLPFHQALRFIDSETQQAITANPELLRETYQKQMQDFLETIRHTSLNEQTDYLLANTEADLGTLLSAWLQKREKLRPC